MKFQKVLLLLSMMLIMVASCEFQPFATVPLEVTVPPTSLPAVELIPTVMSTSATVPIPSQASLAVSAESCAFADGQLPLISTPETPYGLGVDLSGHVDKSLGGGVVQGEEFTIELLLHCDESFGASSMEPYFASDIDHLAIFINWRYEGPMENAPTYILQGIEPYLSGYALDNKEQGLNGGFGISRGLFQPFPDFSNPVTLRFTYMVLFPSGTFSGAVLSFELQQVSDGLKPGNIFVAPLSGKDKILTTNMRP